MATSKTTREQKAATGVGRKPPRRAARRETRQWATAPTRLDTGRVTIVAKPALRLRRPRARDGQPRVEAIASAPARPSGWKDCLAAHALRDLLLGVDTLRVAPLRHLTPETT